MATDFVVTSRERHRPVLRSRRGTGARRRCRRLDRHRGRDVIARHQDGPPRLQARANGGATRAVHPRSAGTSSPRRRRPARSPATSPAPPDHLQPEHSRRCAGSHLPLCGYLAQRSALVIVTGGYAYEVSGERRRLGAPRPYPRLRRRRASAECKVRERFDWPESRARHAAGLSGIGSP